MTYGVVLADGTEHRFTARRAPQHWCSWVMRKLPYGTVFTGCTFFRERS